jgi:DNA-binding transcriptional ArsR family regulator
MVMHGTANRARSDRLDAVFSALADPTRRAILTRLLDGGASVAQLGAGFPISQPAVSKHLRVLEDAGLITRTKSSTQRISRLDAVALRQVDDWLAPYKRFWSEGFDKLDRMLVQYQANANGDPADAVNDGAAR